MYTPDRVELRYGIRPDQVPDFIGLKGDTSDNIPGIPEGSGTRRPGSSSREYGSLEGGHRPRRRPSPAAAREAVQSMPTRPGTRRSAATMRRDLLLDVDPSELVSAPPDRSTLKEIFRRFEFRALLGRVDTLDEALPAADIEMESEAVSGARVPLRLVLNQHKGLLGVAFADGRLAAATSHGVVVSVGSGEIGRLLASSDVATHDAQRLRSATRPRTTRSSRPISSILAAPATRSTSSRASTGSSSSGAGDGRGDRLARAAGRGRPAARATAAGQTAGVGGRGGSTTRSSCH